MNASHALLRIDTTHCYTGIPAESALRDTDIESIADAARAAHDTVAADAAKGLDGEYAALTLPHGMVPVVADIEAMAAGVRDFRNILVIGIGGSSLGSKAVRHALKPEREQHLPQRLIFIENIDPYQLDDLLETLEPAQTALLCISKSGGTIETVVQFLVLRDWLARHIGATQAGRQQWLITDPTQGWLRELAARETLPSLPVPPQVGGRYSVLTAVGLLPLAVVGVDIKALLAGAAANAKRCTSGDIRDNPALELAAIYYLLETRRDKRINIMMPYVNRMRLFVDWFCQLWAESLGKHRADRSVAPAGSLPVRAMGAVDQHSQLQMYLESRADKMFTFIGLDDWAHDLEIPVSAADRERFPYLDGKSLVDVITAELVATRQVITDAGHPNLTIHMPSLDAHVIGQLIDLYQRATIYAGFLYGVNPLDQPAVEKGKKLAVQQLQRSS